MTVWIAIFITCTNVNLDENIKCTWGASEGVYASQKSCEIKAPVEYRRKDVKCVEVEVGITCTLGKCPEVKLK